MRLWIISFLIAITCSATWAAPAPTFALDTNAFLNEGIMPVLYTCDGKDISPQLSWSDAPKNAKSYALILIDKDAPQSNFYHWVIFNLPTKTAQLDEALSKPPAGTVMGQNSFGNSRYNGPCPPKGTTHNYVFTLYALDGTLALDAKANGDTVMEAMKNHIVGQTQLIGVYSRWLK